MNFQNLTNEEIQKVIFAEIEKGTYVLNIKEALIAQGKIPEAYYFTTTTQHEQVMQVPSGHDEPSESMGALQIIGTIVSIGILIFRIATCNS
jgi:hypothetical protein